tara:strand:+ start:580 stop:1590 length:1011 start_codon:yes stop_codon:yes gene_type:complete
MNNFKKIGLSALAGSLAAVSAQAEVTFGGSAQVTYLDDSVDYTTGTGGNAIGQNTNINFSNSGELDNGFTVSIYGYFNDGNGGSISSTAMSLGMGDMGKIVFAESAGTAANGIDDVLPTAYEEVWDLNNGTSYFHAFGSITNSGSVEYQTPAMDMGGITLSATAAYDPQGGTANRDHDAITSSGSTYNSGKAYTVKAVTDFGLTVGAGHENVNGYDASSPEYNAATAYAKYTMGSITVGYQESYIDSAAGAADYESDGYGISFAVNDQMSISYTSQEDTKVELLGTAAVTQESKGMAASYTTGGMTFAIIQVDTDNVNHTTAQNAEATEISLSFAF